MLNKARIAVLVSGGGTNLEALLNAQEAGALPHVEIVLVLSSNPEMCIRDSHTGRLQRPRGSPRPAVCFQSRWRHRTAASRRTGTISNLSLIHI